MNISQKFALSCLLLTAAAFVAPDTHARRDGIGAFGCAGCHSTEGQVDVGLDAAGTILPGQTTTLTLTVQSPGMNSMGFYVSPEDNPDSIEANSGARTDPLGILHSSPVDANGGVATVQFDWTPPNEPGATVFSVHVVAINGAGGGRRGGIPKDAKVSFVYGCEGKTFYTDFDRDGWGSSDFGATIACEISDGLSERDGDCNENNPSINPGAEEICNERDDNCNGEVDEGTEPRALHVDTDGDGYGRRTSDSIMGCAAPRGFVDNTDDCDDNNDAIHPAAEEICNGIDDDCDRRVDEDVRERCGMGLCERVASSCFTMECFPGAPRAELCNGFDDDCDGEIDNDATCSEPGHVCHMFRCIPSDDAEMMQQMPDQGASMMIPDGMELPGPAESEPASEPTTTPGQSSGEPEPITPAAPASETAAPATNPEVTGADAEASAGDEPSASGSNDGSQSEGLPVLNDPPSPDTDGGCSLLHPPRGGGLPALLVTLAAGLVLGRRRRGGRGLEG